jgi:hypothetical protein
MSMLKIAQPNQKKILRHSLQKNFAADFKDYFSFEMKGGGRVGKAGKGGGRHLEA